MEKSENFQVHYYLLNNSHSMEAAIRNKCESEIIAIFQEICESLGVEITLESTAHLEGGLRDFLKLLGKNKEEITIVLAIATFIMSVLGFVSTRFPASNPQKEELDRKLQELSVEEKTLTIEEKKLAIEKLKTEINKGDVSKESVEKAAQAIGLSVKIQSRRSNFYKHLFGYEKITAVGFQPLDKNLNATDIEKLVKKTDFYLYILESNSLPVETIEDAKLEIVAPVLKEGNYKWKGIYEGEPISFSMTDEEFKYAVLSKEISFQHGSSITCVLQILRKLDEAGNIVITGYSVPTVIEKIDGTGSYKTPQGKKHKHAKKLKDSQQNLF